MIKKYRTALVLIFFVLVIGLFFWEFILKGLVPVPGDILLGVYYPWLNDKWGTTVGVGVKNSLMSDVVSLMYPWRFTVIDYIKHGQFPLWDSASFLGESLIGNFQAGILNPFNIIFLLPWAFSINWGIMVMTQPLLAMVCMYVLLKYWKLAEFPAIFGSVAYGLSAQLIIWMEYNLHGFSIAVFPVAIFFTDSYLKSKQIKYLLLYSLLIAFVIFAGYPQYLYYFVFFSFLWLAIVGFFRYRLFPAILKQCLLLGLAIVLGLGISSVQLIPGYESLRSSVRDVDTVALQNNTAFLPFKQIVMGIIPDYFGNPATRNYWGQGYYESFTFYTSLVAIVLMFGAVRLKNRGVLVSMLFLFCVISLCLSVDTPVARSLENLTMLGLRGAVATRVLFIFSFGVSALSALGLENILLSFKSQKKQPGIRWLDKAVASLGPVLFIGITGITALEFWYDRKLTLASKLDSHSGAKYLPDLTIALHNSAWPGLIVVGSVLLLIIGHRFKNKWMLYLLLPLLLADMLRFGWKYLPFTRYDQVFPMTPSLSFLMNQPKPFRVAIEPAEILTANTWEPYGLESPSGYNILVPHQTTDFLSYINYSKTGQASVRYASVLNFDSKLLNIANVEYVATILRTKGVPDPKGDIVYYLKTPQYKPIFQSGAVEILKNQDALNRFFSAGRYRVAPNPNQALSTITSAWFDPSKEITLNKDPGVTNLGTCPVQLLFYGKESFHFLSDCPTQSLLFVADAYHPGWKALVNGTKSVVYRADDEFMAVVLPAGKSDVKLNFWPDSFRMGLYISLASGFLITVLLGLTKRYQIRL